MTAPSPLSSGPSVVDLAEDWLAAKRIGERRDDPGHSARARRADLSRWGQAISVVQGRRDSVAPDHLDMVADLEGVTVAEVGDSDVLLRSMSVFRDRYEDTSRARMLSTIRVFCRWLVRRGHLAADPTEADELKVSRAGGQHLPKAFTADEVDDLVEAAGDPPAAARSAWPERDQALLRLLAGCGLRTSEACHLLVNDLDDGGERPLLRVRRGAKGGKARNIPVPRPTMEALGVYRESRRRIPDSGSLSWSHGNHFFVRADGQALNPQFVDRVLHRCAAQAGVRMPGGAAAHALRHHFGVQLTLRGVPLTALQQLMGHADPRTTSIYTAMAEADLTGILDDAVWL